MKKIKDILKMLLKNIVPVPINYFNKRLSFNINLVVKKMENKFNKLEGSTKIIEKTLVDLDNKELNGRIDSIEENVKNLTYYVKGRCEDTYLRVQNLERENEILINDNTILKNNNKQIMKHLYFVESILFDISSGKESIEKICPVCGKRVEGAYFPFGDILRYNAECPHCRSLERDRALWVYLENETNIYKEKVSVLHVAPERVFNERFMKCSNIDYYPVDINADYERGYIRETMDVTNISYEDNKFDYVICNHVLEHVGEHLSAISELYRVLKPEGVAIINVPLPPMFGECEKTFENQEYNTPFLRKKYFGQFDHIRKYGEDYPDILRSRGFSVNVVKCKEMFSEKTMIQYGIPIEERIIVCSK